MSSTQAQAEITPIARTVDIGFHQTGSALHRLLQEAPYRPGCSDNKTAACRRPRHRAIRWPYMQINQPTQVSWLIFDLDHRNPLIWMDAGLPAPNITVTNPKTLHSHLFYAIPAVCTSEKARPKPIRYMKAVYKAMAAKLDADPTYSGPVAKTPGHPFWSTHVVHSHEYSLGELSEYVELQLSSKWGTNPDIDDVSHSRHCMLFETLRLYAYSLIPCERDNGNYERFYQLLKAYADEKNNFSHLGFHQDLTPAQVKATVKSVARWTWDHYTGSAKFNRGVMQLSDTLPLKKRQSLAAARTHQERKKATERKIILACNWLKREGSSLTQVSIASKAGISRQTAAKYKNLIAQIAASEHSNVVHLKDIAMKEPHVNYGVHQMTAPLPDDGRGEVIVDFQVFKKGFQVSARGAPPESIVTKEHLRNLARNIGSDAVRWVDLWLDRQSSSAQFSKLETLCRKNPLQVLVSCFRIAHHEGLSTVDELRSLIDPE